MLEYNIILNTDTHVRYYYNYNYYDVAADLKRKRTVV